MVDPSKILIVDDKTANLEALHTTLADFGLNIEVVQAQNAEDALRQSLIHEFAIALLDVQMPEIDGFELAEMLRSSQSTKNVPIIFISAVHCDEFFAQRGYEHGAIDYLIKPVLPPRLFNKVATFVVLDQQAKELRAARVIAEKESEAKTVFLSVLSHELRTPLNAILGFGQLLSLDSEEVLTANQSDSVDHIKRGGRHILNMIDQLLDLAKIESGKISYSIEEIDIDQAWRECLDSIQESAHEQQLVIDSEMRTNMTIRSDYTRFKQVMLNLMSNAVKYNRQGGKLSLICEDVPEARIRFSVSDTGRGIPESNKLDVFEPFNRLGMETGEIEGSGIGLTITRQLVELMEGEIGFESEVGSGSTFWVEFPAIKRTLPATAEVFEASKKVASTIPSEAGAVILYIEDNTANQRLVGKIIGRLDGMTLITAQDAETGLVMAEEDRPDLILMDINLPGMDGIAAKKILDGNDLTQNIPVIAVSAAAMQENLERAMEVSFKAYLTKPFQVSELIEVIEKELRQ
jgi:signal transduction histidine kinase